MCFFKAPKVETPKVEPKPTITETSAPEPQALVVGGVDDKAASADGESKSSKKGTGSLKIDLSPTASESGDANVGTGANQAFNVNRGGGGPARPKKAVSKGPTM
ncbi:hypothetical protein [Ralstonia phage RpY2]|uniref:Uncharacterized protein n=2 Tax=Serkorvirus TaxID=2731975 RepID=A0AAF0AGW6_9CAUD|nr:hypothetical protein [Ralstonia phage RpY2]WAX26256.1 hypothetical protein [Ralstonia phage p2106]WAX26380.1 hypothetical protein [Ralstonia phage p2137]